jgi:DNA polymerase III delta subunit
MDVYCLAAVVASETPWKDWWSKLCQERHWPADLAVERWNYSGDFQWVQVLDSFHSFSLFTKHKAIVILQADKALKSLKEPKKILDILSRGPHRVVFQIADPSSLKIDGLAQWIFPVSTQEVADQRSSFKWIDAIHAGQLTEAIQYLDEAIRSDHHPLALIQLVTRDFRLGRVIHHAHSNRFRESEIATRLKVQAFVIQKWLRRQNFTNYRWAALFDRLLAADLEMKSGADEIWVLRKLTFDLVEMTSQKALARRIQKLKKPSPIVQLPWTALPSFA